MKKRLASVLVMSLLVLTSVLPFTAAFVADSSEQGIVNDEQAAVTE